MISDIYLEINRYANNYNTKDRLKVQGLRMYNIHTGNKFQLTTAVAP